MFKNLLRVAFIFGLFRTNTVSYNWNDFGLFESEVADRGSIPAALRHEWADPNSRFKYPPYMDEENVLTSSDNPVIMDGKGTITTDNPLFESGDLNFSSSFPEVPVFIDPGSPLYPVNPFLFDHYSTELNFSVPFLLGTFTGPTIRDAASNQLLNYMGGRKVSIPLTTGSGSPVPDRGNVLTVGPRGPILLQDVPFIEEMQHFDRERIPERVVHAKGAGAFGYFVVTNDITRYSKASVFSKIGKKTPIVVRFSTVIGESGSADTVRDPRGFAIKFYTDEGIWDLVGNNTPIFFVRDPYLFFSFIHSQKRNPVTHLRDADMFWDFLSLRPESIHQVMRLFSDRGIPDGYRHMNGYGSNTFKLVNSDGEQVYCKFHYITDQGERNLPVERAQELASTDPDYSIRDLYNAIADGNFPSWTMYIQVMTFKEAETFRWNPFDVTKIWPEDEFPLIEVGKITLDKNPRNYFVDVEQAAFNPGAMPPGIEPSPDKMLQGRMFSYYDTHLHRVGPNHLHLPINSPFRTHVFNTQRDGEMCYRDNQNGAPNYYPSSFVEMLNSPRARAPPFRTEGEVDRYDSSDEDNYSQPRMMWRSMPEDERLRLVRNMADHISRASNFIQERWVGHIFQVEERFGSLLQAAITSAHPFNK